jgi:hypothetical protein
MQADPAVLCGACGRQECCTHWRAGWRGPRSAAFLRGGAKLADRLQLHKSHCANRARIDSIEALHNAIPGSWDQIQGVIS